MITLLWYFLSVNSYFDSFVHACKRYWIWEKRIQMKSYILNLGERRGLVHYWHNLNVYRTGDDVMHVSTTRAELSTLPLLLHASSPDADAIASEYFWRLFSVKNSGHLSLCLSLLRMIWNTKTVHMRLGQCWIYSSRSTYTRYQQTLTIRRENGQHAYNLTCAFLESHQWGSSAVLVYQMNLGWNDTVGIIICWWGIPAKNASHKHGIKMVKVMVTHQNKWKWLVLMQLVLKHKTWVELLCHSWTGAACYFLIKHNSRWNHIISRVRRELTLLA